MYGAVVALQEHLCNACCATEVAVDLERRMGVEEVRIGAAVGILLYAAVVGQQVEHVGDDLQGVVAIEHTRPEVYLPAQAPARGHIATLGERGGSCGKEFGMGVGRDLIGGVKAVEMRDVAVVVLGVVGIDEPLLQLSVLPYLHWWQGCQGLVDTAIELGIPQAKGFHGLLQLGENIKDNLVVHGGAGGDGGAGAGGSVLGRCRGHGHQPAVLGMTLHIIEQKSCGALEYGKVSAQESLVASEEIVLPEVSREPCSARGEHAPLCAIDGPCYAPDVGVVVRHPPAAAVHLTCRQRPCLTEVAYEREERFGRVAEVAYLRDPVVHLGIDVDGVFAVPHGRYFIVPHALEVCGLSAGLRGADEEVAAVLEHKRGHVGIVAFGESCQTLVGGQCGVGRCGQREADALVLAVVSVEVARHERLESLPAQRSLRGVVLGRSVAADVVVVDEVGGSYDEDGGLGGVANDYRAMAVSDAAAHGLHPHATFGREGALDAFVVGALDDGCDAMVADALLRRERAFVGHGEIESAALVGRELNGNHVIGQGGYHLPPVADAADVVADAGDGIVDVEVALVGRGVAVVPEFEEYVAQREEAHAMRPTDEILVDELLGLSLLAIEDELAHLLQMALGLRAVVVVRAAGPESLFVELNLFGVGAAIDHGAEV